MKLIVFMFLVVMWLVHPGCASKSITPAGTNTSQSVSSPPSPSPGSSGPGIDSPAKTDHVALSTPILKAWQNLEVGVPVYSLDDLAATKGWLDRASVHYIPLQTGIWHIYIEQGYSVFRIYPYRAEGDPQPRIYQSIVLKVAGHLSEAELIAAIRERKETVVIDEYELIGKDISVQKYSRRKGNVPGRDSDSPRGRQRR